MRFIYLLILFLPTTVLAEQASPKQPDPFDTTAIQKKVDELGIPTPSTVQSLEAKAVAAEKSGNWKEAADAYLTLAHNANWLSNLITAGAQPFYNASDKRGIEITDTDIKFENLGNEYKTKRDNATIHAAECYKQLQDTRRAVTLLVSALDVISASEKDLWARARKDLYELLDLNVATDAATSALKQGANDQSNSATATPNITEALGAGSIVVHPRTPQPPYPAQARAAHLTGSGTVRVTFDDTGHVSSASMVQSCGSGILDSNTTQFARINWVGTPNTSVTLPVSYKFQ